MKTLSGSHLKFFTSNQREKERGVRCSREIGLSRQEIGFLVHQKRVRIGFCQPKCVRPVSAVPSAQTNVGSEEIQTVSSDQPKTVHVRFKLNKECAFGQQFLIVGDDMILGLWDPSEGVPLNWSEGHVWTAELDMPSSKVIKYKFILKGNTGIISWQPGTDRVLETWETEKIISVSEDWDSPELQDIVEEDFVGDLNEESFVDSDLLMISESLKRTLVEEADDMVKKLDNVNDINDCSDKPSAAVVAEDTSEIPDGQDLSSSDKGSGLVSEKQEEKIDLLSSNDETRLVLDEGVPVLVPGLVPASTDEIESEEVDEVEKTIVENAFDEAKDSAQSELKDEHESASLRCKETGEVVVDEEEQLNGKEMTALLRDEHAPASLCCTDAGEKEDQQNYGEEQMESNILESDIQWGRRTLQKFLANLGFI